MAKVHALQSNFSTGEVSRKISGRTDIQRYYSALKTMNGAIPLRQGGAIRTPGTVYVKDAVDQDDRGLILSFVYDKQTAYMLEFGNAIIRFYYGAGANIGPVLTGAPAHYSITSPYTLAQLEAVRYVQRANTMILAQSAVAPQQLQRFGNTLWTIGALPIAVYPSAEFGFNPAQTLTLSALSGVGITATAGAAVFLASDVGRQIQSGSGLGTITAIGGGGTTATLTTTRAFDSLNYGSGNWTITDSPQTTLTPSAATGVGTSINLTLGAAGWRNPDDIGKYVKVNDGIVEITGFTSTTVVAGVIRRLLTSATVAQAGTWTLEERSWSATRGFPQSVTLFQQRLVFGGTVSQPNTIWGSAIGDILNFAVGINDDEAFEFTLDSGTADLIQHLETLRALVGFTAAAEHTLRGAGGALATTSVDANATTFFGCGNARPVKIGYEVLFPLFSGMQLRNYSYDFTTDSYQSADVSELADHLLESGIACMAYAKEPYSVLWAVMNDGSLASLTYDANTEIQMRGWAQQNANGVYRGVCSVPDVAGDQVWFRTRRSINGVDKWFIEYQSADVMTHAAFVQTTGLPASSISSGIAHLLGQTVDILLDGVAQKQQVAANPLTFTREAQTRIEVGLPYVSTLVPLRPEFQLGDGSGQGRPTSINDVVLRVIESRGLKINGQPLKGKDFGEGVLNQPPTIRNEDLRGSLLGWSRMGDEDLLEITQDQPYFFHLAALVREVTIN